MKLRKLKCNVNFKTDSNVTVFLGEKNGEKTMIRQFENIVIHSVLFSLLASNLTAQWEISFVPGS